MCASVSSTFSICFFSAAESFLCLGGSILGAGFSSTVSVCVDSEVEFAKVEGGSLREPGETDDDAPATAKDGSSAWGEGLADLAEATATDGSSAWG